MYIHIHMYIHKCIYIHICTHTCILKMYRQVINIAKEIIEKEMVPKYCQT